MNTTEQRFEIVIRDSDGIWTNDIGDANRFETQSEAEEGIEQLRQLDEEWADAEYGVRMRGEQYPL